jgi:hypothetical protein
LNEARSVGDDLGSAMITGNMIDSLITRAAPDRRIAGRATINVSDLTGSKFSRVQSGRCSENADTSIGRVKVGGTNRERPGQHGVRYRG